MLVVENKHWRYAPRCIPRPRAVFYLLMKQVKDKVVRYMVPVPQLNNKEYLSRRMSCRFYDRKDQADHEDIPSYDWSESTIVFAIKGYLERVFMTRFDYALLHLYETGNDYIGWHRDKEATNSIIASVSLGATRKFRVKARDRKVGWDHEFRLENGAVVLMKTTFNRVNLHCVPEEKKVTKPRINITFRQYDRASGYY
jgi:hypothetical protein